MKKFTLALTSLLFTGLLAQPARAMEFDHLHLDLDMEGYEYRPLIRDLKQAFTSPAINRILSVGERNLDWLSKINQNRAEGDKLSFSSKETQGNYPISAPSKYNEEIVVRKYESVVSNLPGKMASVLLHNEPLTREPPIATEDYLAHGRKVDWIYQRAARWLLRSTQLNYLAAYRARDVRGYYHLAHTSDLRRKLQRLDLVETSERKELEEALVTLCLNSNESITSCRNRLASKGDNAWDYYLDYIIAGRNNYNRFFEIPSSARRSDVYWPINREKVARVPFLRHSSYNVVEFLRKNIQEEWSHGPWKLILDFRTRGNIPYVVFRPNVVPHVNGLGGNQITMNSNTPLSEYNVQWTIRHEFGHVLGFPDCYLEFYDREEKVIVSYQIDVTDLMCARTGTLNDRIYKEMEKTYYGKR